jgi:hypothetical protein
MAGVASAAAAISAADTKFTLLIIDHLHGLGSDETLLSRKLDLAMMQREIQPTVSSLCFTRREPGP